MVRPIGLTARDFTQWLYFYTKRMHNYYKKPITYT